MQRKGFQVWRGGSGQSLNSSAIADTLLSGKAFLLTELAEEEVKTLRKARPIGLRLAILFGLSAIIGETSVALLTDIHQSISLGIPSPKVLGFPTDLEAVSP